ncbi:unnamed protein product, partial [Bubo scandiacus]
MKEVFCNTEMKWFTQQKISVATLLFLAGVGGSSFGHIRYFLYFQLCLANRGKDVKTWLLKYEAVGHPAPQGSQS